MCSRKKKEEICFLCPARNPPVFQIVLTFITITYRPCVRNVRISYISLHQRYKLNALKQRK